VNSWVLGTGSQGNAVVLEADGSYVLVDAGLPIRTLIRRLASVGIAPGAIEGVLLTHEHTDHARAAVAGARLYGWRLIATAGTIAADSGLASASAEALAVGVTVELSTMQVTAVPVPHDAAAPVAFVATARRSGARTAVAYDLGCVNDAVRRELCGLDVLIIESNHDEAMLRMGPYPRSVANRIAGPRGHLSNRAAAELGRSVAHRGLRRVVLAHLSANCNEPALALRTMTAAMARGRPISVSVSVAGQSAVTGPFGPSQGARTTQLSLGI
jgi:phosphoribosyl 1,2-cyclic phosphodiesterase